MLYVGCGPLGTLIMTLLHLFNSYEIEIILLDIHQTSITVLSSFKETLGVCLQP